MTDISSEVFREYVYENGTYRINGPLELHITGSGTHRVIDENGLTHRPSPNYLAIRWLPKPHMPPFVK